MQGCIVQVLPCKAERYGTQMGDRSDAYADDSSAEQPGLNFFFLVLVIVFLVLKSRGARPPEGGAARECNRSVRLTVPVSSRPRFHRVGRSRTWRSRFCLDP